MTNRYNRHIILSEIGTEGQKKINQAKVLVIGAGGLGCPILQYLAAAGVGTLGIIDFDIVDETNLQRQILYGKSTLGMNKTRAAKKRLADLNDQIIINTYPETLTFQNALPLFAQYDIIVDGSDNFETRYLVNDACILSRKPLVYGAIFKFEGQVAVFNYNNGPSYRCLFPTRPPEGSVPNCSEIGVLGVLPGIIGTLQANETLKLILGIGEPLNGKLLCYNALNNQTITLNVNRIEEQIDKVLQERSVFEQKELSVFCETNTLISIKDIPAINDVRFIDVRESHEEPKLKTHNVIEIPLTKLSGEVDKLPDSGTKIFFCQSGIRSKKALEIAQKNTISSCFSLKEGAHELLQHLKSIHHENA
ncbi:HesA/MoeB/ThiF family protein [Zhouia spongiae]|uniref:HesA/MoeB/ThiF family protein n=1 Tax=Zhouia spongiae TaxID=2202721 RepID=A0ABY3YIU4_9FLAO|nr:HesA/MoeB/ThiF family protein [Zhouia spongiae]UNY97628.1 HesA/MoeB/ThiF family protein [Zhouia spongiae]